jgi:hypothetical protein
LKVPLGKLDSERMIPLDEETVELIDRITEIRSQGRPLPHPPHPQTRPVLFLTGPEFLPELRQQRRRTLTLIDVSKRGGL